MRLWALLFLAIYFSVSDLKVMGHLIIILGCFGGNQILKVENLEYWRRRIIFLNEECVQIKSTHIYREHNFEADYLSKDDLGSSVGIIFWWKRLKDRMGKF